MVFPLVHYKIFCYTYGKFPRLLQYAIRKRLHSLTLIIYRENAMFIRINSLFFCSLSNYLLYHFSYIQTCENTHTALLSSYCPPPSVASFLPQRGSTWLVSSLKRGDRAEQTNRFSAGVHRLVSIEKFSALYLGIFPDVKELALYIGIFCSNLQQWQLYILHDDRWLCHPFADVNCFSWLLLYCLL